MVQRGIVFRASMHRWKAHHLGFVHLPPWIRLSQPFRKERIFSGGAGVRILRAEGRVSKEARDPRAGGEWRTRGIHVAASARADGGRRKRSTWQATSRHVRPGPCIVASRVRRPGRRRLTWTSSRARRAHVRHRRRPSTHTSISFALDGNAPRVGCIPFFVARRATLATTTSTKKRGRTWTCLHHATSARRWMRRNPDVDGARDRCRSCVDGKRGEKRVPKPSKKPRIVRKRHVCRVHVLPHVVLHVDARDGRVSCACTSGW